MRLRFRPRGVLPRRILAVLIGFGLVLMAGGQVAHAENDDGLRFPRGDQRFRGGPAPAGRQRSVTRPELRQPSPYGSAPGGYYGAPPPYAEPRRYERPSYDPRGAGRPYFQPPPSQPLFPFFGPPREARPSEPAFREPQRAYEPRGYDPRGYDPRGYEPREARRHEPPPRKVKRRVVPVAPSAREDKVEEVEVEPSTFVVVVGDAFAEQLGQGLDVALEEAEDIAIERKLRGDSGLVRSDVHDWPKVIQDYLATNPKITYAVVMVGANDRQAIREGDVSHEPFSNRWREIYQGRVDAMVKAFTDRKIPLLWVGAPPMRNEKASADMLALNDIYRDRVQRGGGVYVDIWPGFVDDQNRYAPTGPSTEGQVVRLRGADGVLFTRAGARKAAHFVDVELKRLIEARGGTAVAAPAAPGQPVAKDTDVDRLISASLPALPEPQGLPSLPAKPIAGPVLPLTRPEVSPGGALVSAPPKPAGDPAYGTERALREGVPPPPRPGRADDFRWPPS